MIVKGFENRSDVTASRQTPRGVGCELSGATATLKLVAESLPTGRQASPPATIYSPLSLC